MEIIKYEETGSAEYPYAVSFNRNAKTLRHFNDFAGVLGRLRVKRYDVKLNAWLIDEQGLEAFEALDKRLFPPKKTMKDKMKDLVSVETKKVSDWKNIGTGMKLNLYDYQKQIVKFIIDSHDQEESHDTLIVAPCGAGKTPSLLAAYLELHNRGIITGPGMIVVKASLKVQWYHEVKKFTNLTPRIVKTYSECVSKEEGMIKRREKKLAGTEDADEKKILEKEIKELKKIETDIFKKQFEGADLYILNYECLNDEKVNKKLQKLDIQFISGDEIQYTKAASAKRSRSLYKFNEAKVKIGATATPVQRDPRDIYGIFKFIHPDLFRTQKDFNALYLRYGYGYRVIGAKNEKLLNSKINPYMYILTKEEVSKHLPKLMVSQRYCAFSDKQQEVNDAFMEELDELNEKLKSITKGMTEEQVLTDKSAIEVNSAISARQTFLQELTLSEELLKESDSPIASKFITGDKGPKIDIMKDLVAEIIDSGEKVVIFSRFARMQSIITDAIHSVPELKNTNIAYIRGEFSADQRYKEAYSKFRDDDSYKVLICSDAGAEGVNLSKCKYMIEMEPAVSYAIQTQRHGRLERADSIHDNVQVFQLITENSWDEIMLKSINKKQQFDASIVKGKG